MLRIYVSELQESGQTFELNQRDSHYLVNVMRQKVGSTIHVFNETVGEWQASVTAIHKHAVVCEVSSQLMKPHQQPKLYLAASRIKPDTWGWMLEKATELGATNICPILSEFTQKSGWDRDKWIYLMKNAAQQCGRLSVPKLEDPQELCTFLKNQDGSVDWFVALERSQALPLKEIINNRNKPMGIIIGPEGGWSNHERGLFDQTPYVTPVLLTQNILRSETAAIYGLSLLTA